MSLALYGAGHKSFFKILLDKGIDNQHGQGRHDHGAELNHFRQLVQLGIAAGNQAGLSGACGTLNQDAPQYQRQGLTLAAQIDHGCEPVQANESQQPPASVKLQMKSFHVCSKMP